MTKKPNKKDQRGQGEPNFTRRATGRARKDIKCGVVVQAKKRTSRVRRDLHGSKGGW